MSGLTFNTKKAPDDPFWETGKWWGYGDSVTCASTNWELGRIETIG
jgi:hypothetical protein